MYAKLDRRWKECRTAHCKLNDEWKEIYMGWCKLNGVWKPMFHGRNTYRIQVGTTGGYVVVTTDAYRPSDGSDAAQYGFVSPIPAHLRYAPNVKFSSWAQMFNYPSWLETGFPEGPLRTVLTTDYVREQFNDPTDAETETELELASRIQFIRVLDMQTNTWDLIEKETATLITPFVAEFDAGRFAWVGKTAYDFKIDRQYIIHIDCEGDY